MEAQLLTSVVRGLHLGGRRMGMDHTAKAQNHLLPTLLNC